MLLLRLQLLVRLPVLVYPLLLAQLQQPAPLRGGGTPTPPHVLLTEQSPWPQLLLLVAGHSLALECCVLKWRLQLAGLLLVLLSGGALCRSV
jgi:hypothetical protein